MFWKRTLDSKNLVNRKNSAEPNYDISDKDTYFVLYLSPAGKLCIVGEKDNNYIVWCSITDINSKELNKQIFDYVASKDFDNYTQLYKVLDSEMYREVESWHKSRITRSNHTDKMHWTTPFGHGYGNDIENHGKYFSSNITIYHKKLVDKCEFRCEANMYYNILCSYLDILKSDDHPYYYNKMEQLISILEDESYLRVCQDEHIRLKYLECINQGYTLYNRYMTASR